MLVYMYHVVRSMESIHYWVLTLSTYVCMYLNCDIYILCMHGGYLISIESVLSCLLDA